MLDRVLDGAVREACERLQALQLQLRREANPDSLEERIDGSAHWNNINGALSVVGGSYSPGFAVFRAMEKTLDKFLLPDGTYLRRSPDQRRFHHHMIKTCLPKIFSGEWDTSSEAIIDKLGLRGEPLHEQVIISTPRRYGKTWSVSMFVAACLYCIPGFTVIIYSVSDRQSKMMMDTVVRMYNSLPGAARRRVIKNSEYFVVRDVRGGQSWLQCLPGSSATTRGVGANLIIMEEAAWIKEKLFYENIVPLMGVKETALVGISTPPSETGNYYLRLFDCKDDDGQDIFSIVKIELQCAACMEKREVNCPHKVVQPPAWKSQKRQKMQQAIYGVHPLYYLREVLGVPISDDIYVFTGQYVENFVAPAKCSFPVHEPMNVAVDKPAFVFIGIDPCGGGTMSDTSFCALTFRAGDRNPVVSSCCRSRGTRDRCRGGGSTR